MSSNDRNDTPNFGRRRFVATVGAAAGGIALAGIACKSAQAADLPALKESDSLAASMGYKEDTKTVDNKKHATHKPDQTCANCQFYQGAAGSGSGPCQLFPGKAVNAKGWCQVWAKKA